MSTFDRSLVWPILRLARKLSRRRRSRQSPLLGGIATLVTVIGIGSAVAATAMAFVLGMALLPGAEPFTLLLVWDGVIVVFLLLWLTGLLVQLQLGGESLSLDKLLHLPVSPLGAFLMNFVGSQMRVSLLMFLGAMLGLTAASALSLGPAHLILIPLVLAFASLVTAVTHQLQSWLARLFVNKRRRGTVVAVTVLTFIILVNLPAVMRPFFRDADVSIWEILQIERWTLLVNAVLPPGWLALGAWGAGRGQIWISLLSAAGMFGIATLSLRRCYRKTIDALAQGGAQARDPKPAATAPKPAPRTAPPSNSTSASRGLATLSMLFDGLTRHVPERSRAVVWVSLRIWMRAPQGKMVLLSPLLLIMLYVLLFARLGSGAWAAQFAVLAMMGFMIVMAFNLFANLFGQDGNGFRALVLAGVPPREMLLGKNLALLPYALILGTVIMAVLQWVHPLAPSHVLANAAQLLILYLVGCMLGNAFSIRAPWPMSATSMGSRNAPAVTFLASFLILLLLIVSIAPLAIPIWIEKRFAPAVPIYLAVSVIELGLVALLYRRMLAGQSRLLTERLETVLERVTQPID